MWWYVKLSGSQTFHSWLDVPGRAERTGFLTLRVRHENMYNFAKNLDQNGLLGEKLSQNENRSIKNFEIEKNQKMYALKIFNFHTISNDIFRFFISKIFEKTQNFHFPNFSYRNFFIENCMKNRKSRSKKIDLKICDGPTFILT